MQRFFSQHKKKKVTASPELVKLWGTSAGRVLAENCWMARTCWTYLMLLHLHHLQFWMVHHQNHLGEKLRGLLHKNNMDMSLVNLQIERESIQDYSKFL